MVSLHKLEERAHFEALYSEFSESVRKALGWLAEGRGDPQACYGGLCKDKVTLACVALILGLGDEEAQKHFHEAVEYAAKWLTAPGSTKGPRVYNVQQEASQSGIRTLAIHERRPSREPSKLSVIGYSRILNVTVAFGDRAAMQAVASFPEEDYQSPDVVAPPSLFGSFRAWKAWLKGQEAEARKEALAALKVCKEGGGRVAISAFLSMVTGDEAGMKQHLEERLKGHKKQYQRQGNLPEGIVCMDGLALCRLAVERGLRVEEWPYLPVRLLPNYKPAVH